jgi:Big-like domain-containing protein
MLTVLTKRTLLLIVLLGAIVSAQAPARRATNASALLAFPAFYHLHQVLIVGKMELRNNGELRLTDEGGAIRVVFKGSPPDDVAEVRGEFWDLGRMNADDPRLAGYDLRRTFQIDPEGAWPRPGQVTAIVATAIAPASPPLAPSIRAIVLFPARFVDQKVTLTGQFAGRNLLGDLPDAPARSRYDFVLRTTDAAIWVSNIRPRGRDFDLALDARIDTGRWLEVSGTVQQGRGLQWLDATGGTVRLTKPPAETTAEAPIRVPAAPPPEVVFSAPTQDETDVGASASVRIQFSRDINPATFKGRISVRYVDSAAPQPPPAPAGSNDAVAFTTQYLPGTRVLEIRFAQPLERFRTVQVELGEGIVGTDQQPLVPWKVTFQTGS